MSKFSIESLRKFFSEPEIFFAIKMMQEEEEERLFFFCFLFRSSMYGHLCVSYALEECHPKPLDVLSEEKLQELSLEEKEQFTKAVFSGLKKCEQIYRQEPLQHQSEKQTYRQDLEEKNFHQIDPIVWIGGHIYLQKNYVMETTIIQEVKRLIKPFEKPKIFDIALLEKEQTLTGEQKEAIKKCLQNRLSIICGGPGTGKSYLASFLLSIFSQPKKQMQKEQTEVEEKTKTEEGVKVVVAAPTGKAALQLKQKILQYQPEMKSIYFETKTLHSLLRVNRRKERSSDQELDADFVLVDEASMMDAEIMMYLFSSIGEKTHIVLLGDVDQLPPVEAGFLFTDLVKIFLREKEKISFLSKAHRFENFSLLQLAEWIKEEKKEEIFSLLESQKISHFPLSSIFSKISKNLSHFIFPSDKKKDVSNCLDQLEKFCILTPLRQGPFGVENLNLFIRQRLFQKSRIGQWYYLPILVCKNDPEHNLYNGMLGMVIGRVAHKKRFSLEDRVYFRLGQEVLDLPAYVLGHYEEAFCLSIHKSQGSEFDKVFLCLPPGSERFGKELFYTGVTRAKKELVLVAEKKEIEETLKTTKKRNSALVERFYKPSV